MSILLLSSSMTFKLCCVSDFKMIIHLFLIIFLSMTKESEGNQIIMVHEEESSMVIYSKAMPELKVNITSPVLPTIHPWCSDENENVVEGSPIIVGTGPENVVMQFKIPKPKNSTWLCKFTGYSKDNAHIERYYNITFVIYDTHFSTNDIGSSTVTSTATDVTSTTTGVTSVATNVTSTVTNVTSTPTKETLTATNVTSTVTNVTSTPTKETLTATNMTSTVTNVTSMPTNSIDKKRGAYILQPSMSPSELVNVIFVGPALLVIGLLLGGLLYYRNKVKMNEIPDTIKSRAPMELPSEVIYATAYSHIIGYQKPMEKPQIEIPGYQQLMEQQQN